MNASRFIYLIKEYTYIYPRYIVYDKIIELESEENTLEVFKSITNLKSKGYDDDEILFLYKYYIEHFTYWFPKKNLLKTILIEVQSNIKSLFGLTFFKKKKHLFL